MASARTIPDCKQRGIVPALAIGQRRHLGHGDPVGPRADRLAPRLPPVQLEPRGGLGIEVRQAPPPTTAGSTSKDQAAPRRPRAASASAGMPWPPAPPTAQFERCPMARSRTGSATPDRDGRTAWDNAFRNSRATSRFPAAPCRPDRTRANRPCGGTRRKSRPPRLPAPEPEWPSSGPSQPPDRAPGPAGPWLALYSIDSYGRQAQRFPDHRSRHEKQGRQPRKSPCADCS